MILFLSPSIQMLYSLDHQAADSPEPLDDKPSSTPQTLEAQENPAHKSFLEIFGQRKRPNGETNLLKCGHGGGAPE